MREGSDLFNGAADVLAEALFVADLLGQCRAGDKYNFVPERIDLEDLT